MRTAVLSWIAVLTSAQSAQTLIVDAANDPGTCNTDLPSAVGGAPDGAVLPVRPGAYSGFAYAGKGLTILADPGVTVTGPVAISSTTPVQGRTPAHPSFLGLRLVWQAACQGPITGLQATDPVVALVR